MYMPGANTGFESRRWHKHTEFYKGHENSE